MTMLYPSFIVALVLILPRKNRTVSGFNSLHGQSISIHAKSPRLDCPFPSLSPLRVASTAWATSNDGVGTTDKAEVRPKTKSKAPLVDSALLRFLSSQKKSAVVVRKDKKDTRTTNGGNRGFEIDVPPPPSDSYGLPGIQIIDDAEIKEEVFDQFSNIDAAPSGLVKEPAAYVNVADGVEPQSWLSQYNAQKVALKLKSVGVDASSANHAGKIVQDYVLSRVTRNRIRSFLKERDELWETGRIPLDGKIEGRSGIGMEDSISPALKRTLDLDQVLTVMMEHGLTGRDIAAILSHTPSVAMMKARRDDGNINATNISAISNAVDGSGTASNVLDEKIPFTLEDTLQRILVKLLGETLSLRRYDARKVIRSCPGLLSSKGSRSAEQVVQLMVALGSSTSSLAREKSSLNSLLSRSPALLFRLVAFLGGARVQIPLEAIGPILRQKGSKDMLDAVAPIKYEALVGLEGTNLTDNTTNMDRETHILEHPKANHNLRQQTIQKSYQSMEAVAGVLRRNAGIRNFQKILASHPNALLLNPSNIALISNYLRDHAGMTKDDIAKAIQTYPLLLEQDVSQIKHVVEFLLSIDVEEEALPGIFRSFPATLTLDVEENMIPVVNFIRGIGVRNVGRFVTRLPPVLGYSIEDDLRPKWEFLKEVCNYDYFEVARFPAYFSYPLERVIKMRYEYLRDCKRIPIQVIRVDDVLRYGDRDFAREIALDEDDGESFAKFVEERSCRLQTPIQMRRKQHARKNIR